MTRTLLHYKQTALDANVQPFHYTNARIPFYVHYCVVEGDSKVAVFHDVEHPPTETLYSLFPDINTIKSVGTYDELCSSLTHKY